MIMLKSKIHNARLTECNLDYEGSIQIDTIILEDSGILPYEKVLVVNASNGERLETYAIPGKAGSGEFMLNGAAALKGSKGDRVTLMSFCLCEKQDAKKLRPQIIILDGKDNKIAKKKEI